MNLDLLERVASKIRATRDLVVFSSMSTATMTATRDLRVHLTVTQRALDAGQERWMLDKLTRIQGITWKRCVFSPFPDEWLGDLRETECVRWLYCRVHIDLLDRLAPDSLRHLTVHQLTPGDNPGIGETLKRFPLLETLSLTFSNWGFVVVSDLPPALKRLELRYMAGHVDLIGPLPASLLHLTVHADTHHPNYAFPPSIQSIDIESHDAIYDDILESRCAELAHVRLRVAGCIVPGFLEHAPNVRVVDIEADTIVIDRTFARLRHIRKLDLNSRRCFALTMMPMLEWEKVLAIPGSVRSCHVPFEMRKWKV